MVNTFRHQHDINARNVRYCFSESMNIVQSHVFLLGLTFCGLQEGVEPSDHRKSIPSKYKYFS